MNKTPKGCNNIGGKVAEKIEYCRNTSMELFAHYGYKPFSPAELQLVESVWENVSKSRARRFIPVMSPHGEPCVLRGDLTLSAVAYLSTHFNSNERPLRLSYADRVYMVPETPKSNLEENQVGVELIGWESTGADVETVSLLLRTLDQLGIEKSVIVLGDVSILSYILQDIPNDKSEEIINALQKNSYTEYRNIIETIETTKEKKELLSKLPTLKGNVTTISQVSTMLKNAKVVTPLKSLCDSLCKLGYEERIRVDFSFVRDLGYYSGPIYNAYSSLSGALLGGGGRYDGLLTKVGIEGEACGFALNLKELADHCNNKDMSPQIMLWGGQSDPADVLRYADGLSKKGISFELSWTKDKKESQRIATLRKHKWWFDFADKKITNIKTGETTNQETFERDEL
ncbi:MAG: ATP phosphoribosyltransferase regulatory subunit [Synergistaceae bacterium]